MKYVYLMILPLLLLTGCSFNSSSESTVTEREKVTFLIQTHSNTVAITSLINEVLPLVNGIIKEELGLDKDFDFDFFIPTKTSNV